MFAIAYRMLGSVVEAEDVVQEALLRALNALREGTQIESPRAYATTVTSREQRDELARRCFAAARDGQREALEALLAEDVTLHGDGGGKLPALARALEGRERVARTLVAWSRYIKRIAPGAEMRPVEVNGQPGALLLDSDERVMGVWALDITDAYVRSVRSIINPDKLRHLGPLTKLTPRSVERGD